MSVVDIEFLVTAEYYTQKITLEAVAITHYLRCSCLEVGHSHDHSLTQDFLSSSTIGSPSRLSSMNEASVSAGLVYFVYERLE